MTAEQILYIILLSILGGLLVVLYVWLVVRYVKTRNSKTNQWFREVNTKRRTSSGVYVYGYTDKEWEKYNGR